MKFPVLATILTVLCSTWCLPPAVASTCGNGSVDAGETCDDGNLLDDDGCDSNCSLPACGNGVVDPGEGCDDGNLVDGDGCSADCRREPITELRCYKIRTLPGSPSVSRQSLSVQDEHGNLTILTIKPELYCAAAGSIEEARGMMCYKARATSGAPAGQRVHVVNGVQTVDVSRGPLTRFCVPSVRPFQLGNRRVDELPLGEDGVMMAASDPLIATWHAAVYQSLPARPIELFDVDSGVHVRSLQPPVGRGSGWGSVMSFVGKRLAVGGGDDHVDVFDVDTGTLLESVVYPSNGMDVSLLNLRLTPTRLIAQIIQSGSGIPNNPYTYPAQIIDLATGQFERTVPTTGRDIATLGERLVATDTDESVAITDLASGAVVERMLSHGHPVGEFGYRIVPVGDHLAIGAPGGISADSAYHGRVEIWDPATGQFVRELSYPSDESIDQYQVTFGADLSFDGAVLGVGGHFALFSSTLFFFDPLVDADLFRERRYLDLSQGLLPFPFTPPLLGVRPGIFVRGRTIYQAACGNGALDPGEECDDGNTLDGDACPASCSLGSTRFLTCYKAAARVDQPVGLSGTDTVGFYPHSSDVTKLDSLCGPSALGATPSAAPMEQLSCYRYRDSNQPKIHKSQLQVHDWLGDHILQTVAYAVHCVPAVHTPL